MSTIAELPVLQAKNNDENAPKSLRLHKFEGGVTSKVREGRHFVKSPVDLNRVISSSRDRDTYLFLNRFCWGGSRHFRRGVQFMVRESGICKPTLMRSFSRLEKLGILTRRKDWRGSGHTHYHLVLIDEAFFAAKVRPRLSQIETPTDKKIKKLKKLKKQLPCVPQLPRAEARKKSSLPEPRKSLARSRHWQRVRGDHRNWREWRMAKALERNSIATRKQVGVFEPPPPHDFMASAEDALYCEKCGFGRGAEHHEA